MLTINHQPFKLIDTGTPYDSQGAHDMTSHRALDNFFMVRLPAEEDLIITLCEVYQGAPMGILQAIDLPHKLLSPSIKVISDDRF